MLVLVFGVSNTLPPPLHLKLLMHLAMQVNGKDVYVVKGLVNLGNTCFFNSVLQNLLAMDTLRAYLFKCEASMGTLTTSLKNIFLETSVKTGSRNAINPDSLFGCVCAKAPQFSGYQQQDSHELLRYLLDGLSSEEIFADKSENGGSLSVNSTFVDAMFGGRLSSTVCCVECGHASVVYEPFLDLSLPVPTKKPSQKKAQCVSRTRKMKSSLKRGGKFYSKLDKGEDTSMDNEVCCSIKEATLGCCSSADYVGLEPSNVVDVNCLASHYSNNVAEKEATSTRVSPSGVQGVDSMTCSTYIDSVTRSVPQECDGMAWLDYPKSVPPLEDQNLAADYEDPPRSLDSGCKVDDCNIVQDTIKSNGEACSNDKNFNGNFESTVGDFGDEYLVQVQSNQTLLLGYKEDDTTAGEGCNLHAENSPSGMPGGEDSSRFDGLFDLFNEPEVDVPSSSAANTSSADEHFGNGYVAVDVSESDPDEVDNTDSPVTVEGCLAHFIKSELLSGEHAWHCENCSKQLLEGRQNLRTHQFQTAGVIKRNLSNDDSPSSEAFQVRNLPSPVSATNVLIAHSNGSSDLNESFTKLGMLQINGLCTNSTNGREESCMPENTSLYNMKNEREEGEPCSSAFLGSSHEASSISCSNDSQSVHASHVHAKKKSRLGEKHKSKEEEVGSKIVKLMSDATKTIHIEKAPLILTIHLKRFTQDACGRFSKLNGYVGFEEYLDLGPFLDSRSTEKGEHVYRLVGVVEHSGSMRSGHYVAYVRGGSQDESRQTRSVWYHASDADVHEITLEEVLRTEAYVLFYEKRSKEALE